MKVKVMAYKKLAKSSKPISLDAKNKQVEGYLVNAKCGVGAKKKSSIYTFVPKKGEPFRVWGNIAIDSSLLNNEGDSLDEKIKNCMVKLVYIRTETLTGGNKFNVVDVFVDFDDERTEDETPF